MDYRTLMDKAIEASKNAYCPYSKFPVGACVLTDNDKVYTGCNFENSSFGLTICAERNAIGSAVVDGEKKVKAVACYEPHFASRKALAKAVARAESATKKHAPQNRGVFFRW